MSTTTSAPRPQDVNSGALQQLANEHRRGYRSVGTMAYDVIKGAILDGTLKPGQRLRQETLAEAIGISRLPVRSALIQLEADGLVEFHARRGAVVKTLSRDVVREVYHLRALLESEALRLSMAQMTPARIARIRQLGEAADDEAEGSSFMEARTEFYAELFHAEQHPVLWEIIQQLRLKLGRYVLGRRVVDNDEGAHPHSHADLVAAVEAGDADEAVHALRAHLDGVRTAVLEILDRDTAAKAAEK